MTDAEHELEDEEPRLESKNENSNDTASQRNVVSPIYFPSNVVSAIIIHVVVGYSSPVTQHKA